MKHLDYAKYKIDSVIETINYIGELDFPYDDSLKAISFIKDLFLDLKAHLNNISNPNAARSLCKQISKDIDDFLLAIGFIVRTCDVRGALELQGPLLRLTHKAIGDRVKLLISSEWRYSPFTLLYPGDFGDEFVLVGLPVSEAGNPLIAPLSGHELGHNIWRRLPKLQEFFAEKIQNSVDETIKNRWEDFSKTFGIPSEKDFDQDVSDKLKLYGKAHFWGISQCEEMFCDFIGLTIFGESYLHAFQYMISPGGGFRNPVYPSTRSRVDSLVRASSVLSICIPENFIDDFDDSDIDSDEKNQFLLETSDKASQSVIDSLVEAAILLCKKVDIINRDDDEKCRIVKSFKKIVPENGTTGIANIINAAWQIFLEPVDNWAKNYPEIIEKPEKRLGIIHELALKNFEVFEIERIQEERR